MANLLSMLHASAKTAVPTGTGILISVPGSNGRLFDELTVGSLIALVGSGDGYTSATIDGSGHLILTKTDGTPLDLGNVQGAPGASVDGQLVSQFPVATVTGTMSIVAADASDNPLRTTPAALNAWQIAQATDLLTSTAVSSTIAGDQVLMFRSGAPVLLLASALGTSSGSGGTPATAPSQVGSLTAGTPTSTTIPVTYTAATGTAPITYTGLFRVTGSGSYAGNGGAFTATGGTFTGLTASTSYDLQIVATNSAGSSTTTLTSVADGAAQTGSGGNSGRPAMTLTGATFNTIAAIDGAVSLKGGQGTGSAMIPIPANDSSSDSACATAVFLLKCGTDSITPGAPFLTLIPATDTWHTLKFSFNGTHLQVDEAGTYDLGVVRDGQVHEIRYSCSSFNQSLYADIFVDGVHTRIHDGASHYWPAGNAALVWDGTKMSASDLLDAVEIGSGDQTGSASTGPVRPRPVAATSRALALYQYEAQTGGSS